MTGRAAPSPYRNFAENLRALCARQGSIAAVCRALGMNRQQFNKYLSGSTLPNAPTLERICAFFEIEASRLFQGLQDPAADAAPLPPEFMNAAASVLGRMRDSTLRPGCYYFYSPWPRDPSKCLRAALLVYRKDGLTRFSRFTKFRTPGLRQRYYISGRHDGIVLDSDRTRYLLAVNKKGFGDMSLVSLGIEAAQTGNFISGLGVLMDPAGRPEAMRTTLEFRGGPSLLRRTISEACILPLADPSVPDEVRQSVAASSCLESFSLLDSLPRPLRRGGAN